MNVLLDAESEGLKDRNDVKGQLLTFVFAGHDTTAHAMLWLLWEVSQNSELQEALAVEAKEALPLRQDFPIDLGIVSKKLSLWIEFFKRLTGSTQQQPLALCALSVTKHWWWEWPRAPSLFKRPDSAVVPALK